MPRVKPILYVEHADPREVYGAVTTPMVTMSETMQEANLPGCERSNVRYDKALKCLYLEPLKVSADEALSGWTTNGGTCKEVLHRVSGDTVIRQANAPTIETGWSATKVPAGGAEGDALLYSGQGLHLWLYRDAPKAGALRTAAGCFVAAAFMDSDGAGGIGPGGLRIFWGYGNGPRLEETADSGATWWAVGDLPMADGGKAAGGGGGEVLIEVLRINGRLSFRAGQNNAMSESGVTVLDRALAYPIRLGGRGCNAAWWAGRCAYATEGTFRNSERDRPWNNTSVPVTRVEGSVNSSPATQTAPDGVTMAVDTAGGAWTWRYTLTLASDGVATPWVTRLKAMLASVYVAPNPEPVWQHLAYVDGFRLTHRFDPQDATVRVNGQLNLYNHHGQWRDAYGLRAVRIWAGLADESGVLWGGYGAPNGLRFFGYLNLDSEIGEEDGWLSLDDRVVMPQKKAYLNGQYSDDDCIYHAVRVGAQHAGITSEWMRVGPGAPIDAWTCDGVSCDPAAGHFRLGNGTGFQPRWRPGQGEKVWSFWQRIRARYGMALGFTPDGYFTMYPWEPWRSRANWVPRQVFSAVPQFTAGRPNLNEVLAGARKRTSIRELVNSLTLLGLDQATWEPILAHRFDAASAFGSGFGYAPPVNYLGFVADAVESSTSYASRAELNAVIDRVFNAIRQPRMGLYPLPGWAQPLFVTDFVGVDDSLRRQMPGGDAFWVSAIDEDWRTLRGANGAVRQDYRMAFGLDLVPYDLPSVLTDEQAAFAVNSAATEEGAPASYGVLDQSEAGDYTLAS